MDKKLKNFIEQCEAHIANQEIDANFRNYYDRKLQQFQHERFVHLVVTLFFALFMLITLIASLAFGCMPGELANTLSLIFSVLLVILLVTVLFYAWHYYRLENGVEKLEELCAKIWKIEE